MDPGTVKGRRQTSPQEPHIVLQDLVDGRTEDLTHRAELDGQVFASLPQEPLELRDATVLGCRFIQMRSPEADLCGAVVRETEFESPDLTIVQAWRGRWSDVRVRGGRLGVLEAYDSVWNSVELVGCRFSFVNLRGSEVNDLIIGDCEIEELDVSEASLRRASLAGTHVQRLNVRGARMEHVDLRSTRYDEITGVASLRGAIITEVQLADLAPLLAQSLGIQVTE